VVVDPGESVTIGGRMTDVVIVVDGKSELGRLGP
jgi:hypothetical protein